MCAELLAVAVGAKRAAAMGAVRTGAAMRAQQAGIRTVLFPLSQLLEQARKLTHALLTCFSCPDSTAIA